MDNDTNLETINCALKELYDNLEKLNARLEKLNGSITSLHENLDHNTASLKEEINKLNRRIDAYESAPRYPHKQKSYFVVPQPNRIYHHVVEYSSVSRPIRKKVGYSGIW